MNFSISNAIIEHTPKLPVNSQKLLFLVFSNITNDSFKEAKNNKSSMKVDIEKADIYKIFNISSSNHLRRDFYTAKRSLHEVMRIDTKDLYVETSYISGTIEHKRVHSITFEIPFSLMIFQPDFNSGNFFNVSLLDLAKINSRYSQIFYQIFRINYYKTKYTITPMEFNSIFNVVLTPGKILQIIQGVRDDFHKKGIDMDFTICPNKVKNKTVDITMHFIKSKLSLEDYSNELDRLADEVIVSIEKYSGDGKDIFLKNKLNDLNEMQTNRVFNHFYKKRKEIDQNIINKIMSPFSGEISSIENINFKRTILQVVLLVQYSSISNTINKCVIEIKKGKIVDKAGFVLSRLKMLIKDHKG